MLTERVSKRKYVLKKLEFYRGTRRQHKSHTSFLGYVNLNQVCQTYQGMYQVGQIYRIIYQAGLVETFIFCKGRTLEIQPILPRYLVVLLYRPPLEKLTYPTADLFHLELFYRKQ